MERKRVRIQITFTSNLDMVPGWGYDPADWADYVKMELGRQAHYKPTVEINDVSTYVGDDEKV